MITNVPYIAINGNKDGQRREDPHALLNGSERI
jgi:hypothetical protein